MAYVFNSKIENPDRLERMLVARRPIVDLLEKKAKALIENGTLSQSLLIGPRGSGKTHMLRVFFNRIWVHPEREVKVAIAYMVEDEYGIDTFLDLLIRIFNSFMRWYEDDQTPRLLESIERLKRTAPDYREGLAVEILNEYLGERDLLIIIENLNEVFQGLGTQGQAKLRDYIQQYNNVAIFGSSQALFVDIQKEDKPFQNFFNIVHLKRLRYEEAMELVKVLAEEDEHEEFKAFLDSPRGRANVHAVYDLTQGNHRLLVIFFDFLKAEFKSDLADAFLHTIDKLKPYYESYFRLLSPQQQKIVQYLSSQRHPVSGKEISLNCFIAHTTVSKQMSELQKLGYVDNQRVGKEAYYEISEPMLRLAFEVNEDKNGVISIFIDFLTQLYEVEEITKRYLKFKYLSQFVEGNQKQLYKREASFYERALDQHKLTGLDSFEHELRDLKTEEDINAYLENIKLKGDSNITFVRRLMELREKKEYDKALVELDLQIEKGEDSPENYYLRAFILSDLEEYAKSVEAYQKVIALNPKYFQAYTNLGSIYILMNKYEEAEMYLKKSLSIKPHEAIAWFNLGTVYRMQGRYSQAIEALDKSLELDDGDSDGWYWRAMSKMRLGENEKAMSDLKVAVELDPENGTYWFDLGMNHKELMDFESALHAFQRSFELNPDDSSALNNIGNCYSNLNERAKAKKAYEKSIELNELNESAWKNIADVYFEESEFQKAETAYKKVLEIDPHNTLSISALSNLYSQMDRFSEAEQLLKDSREAMPDNVEIIIDLILLYVNMDRLEEALSLVLVARKDHPDEEEFWFLTGIVLNAMKDEEQLFEFIDNWISWSNSNHKKYLSNFHLVVETLIDSISTAKVEKVLDKLIRLFRKYDRYEELNAYFAGLLFSLLKNADEDNGGKLKDILGMVSKSELDVSLRVMWEKFVPVGIAYFVYNNEKPLLGLAKEERELFESFSNMMD